MEAFFNSFSSFAYLSLSIALKSIFVGATLSIIIFGTKKFFKNKFSDVRYVTLWSILAFMIILPILSVTVSLNYFDRLLPTNNSSQEQTSPQPLIADNTNQNLNNQAAKSNANPQTATYVSNTHANSVASTTQTQTEPINNLAIILRLIPVLLLFTWLAITLLLLYRVFKSYDTVLHLKHSAKLIDDMGYSFVENALAKIELQRPVRVGTSDGISVPIAAGFKYPMILLPTNILHELTNKELEIIMLHELTHLKRYDDFGKLGQRVIEAFGFFNPAITWIGQQLDLEREVACDSYVINTIGSTNKYAECLTRLMKITQGTGTTLIPGFYSSKKQIFKRFEEMFMNEKNKRNRFSKLIVASFFSLSLLLSITLIQVTSAFAVPGSFVTFQEVNDIFTTTTEVAEDTNDSDIIADTDFDDELNLLDDEIQDDAPIDLYSSRSSRGNRFGLFSRLKNKTKNMLNNSNSTTITSDDDGTTTIFWDDNRSDYRIKIAGEIEFTDDDKWIKSIEEDGYIALYEKNRQDEIEFDIELDKNGQFDILYKINDDEKEFDDDAKKWVAKILEQVFMKTGINADKRVKKMYDHGGADEVLEYISKLSSNYIHRIYFTELLLQKNLSEDDYAQILTLIDRKIDSDYDRAELLIDISKTIQNNDALIPYYIDAVKNIDSDYDTRRVLTELSFDKDTDKNLLITVLDIIREINSDYDKAELLISLSKLCKDDTELNDHYIKAMKEIDSDYDTRRVFSAIASDAIANGKVQNGSHAVSDESFDELLLLAEELDSDYEKAEYLLELADMLPKNSDKHLQLFHVIETIDSDYERRRVLDNFRYDCDENSELLLAKLQVISRMDSDYEKVEALIEHSDCAAKNHQMRDLYLRSLRRVDSDYEKKRAIFNLADYADFKNDKVLLKDIMALTNSFESEYEITEIMSELAEYCKDNDELEELFIDIADRLESDYEKEKLYKAMNRKYKSQRSRSYNHYD